MNKIQFKLTWINAISEIKSTQSVVTTVDQIIWNDDFKETPLSFSSSPSEDDEVCVITVFTRAEKFGMN